MNLHCMLKQIRVIFIDIGVKGKGITLQAWTGSQVSRHSAHGGGTFVSPTHRPLLSTRKYSWYSFLLEAESTPVSQCGRNYYVNENFQWQHRGSNPRPSALWRSASTNCVLFLRNFRPYLSSFICLRFLKHTSRAYRLSITLTSHWSCTWFRSRVWNRLSCSRSAGLMAVTRCKFHNRNPNQASTTSLLIPFYLWSCNWIAVHCCTAVATGNAISWITNIRHIRQRRPSTVVAVGVCVGVFVVCRTCMTAAVLLAVDKLIHLQCIASPKQHPY